MDAVMHTYSKLDTQAIDPHAKSQEITTKNNGEIDSSSFESKLKHYTYLKSLGEALTKIHG